MTKGPPLSHKVASSFTVAKRFQHQEPAEITSLDFSDSGEWLLACAANRKLHIYNAKEGKHRTMIPSEKYGCHLGRYAHNDHNCLYVTGNNAQVLNHSIRYLSIYENSFLRSYDGHTNWITSLEVSPVYNTFLTASFDNTAKFWDVRTSHAQATMQVKSPGYVAFDPSAKVFGIASCNDTPGAQQGSVQFFDARRMLDFETISLPPHFKFNKIEFSNDSRWLLFSSTNAEHLIYDALDFKLITKLVGQPPIPQTSPLPDNGAASFSPDGQYVYSGTGEGLVAVWALNPSIHPGGVLPERTPPAFVLHGDNRPKNLLWNPKNLQFVTADLEVSMWLPSLE